MNKELTPHQQKTIQNFWNWFQDNEQVIYYALKLGINTDEVMKYLDQNLDYVSKRIEYIIYENSSKTDNYQIIFSAFGYKKLFPKIAALGDRAPQLEYFTIQTFIKPYTKDNFNQIPEGFQNLINQSWIKLEDYNITNKKIKLILYLPEYFDFENEIESFIKAETTLMFTLGEVNYKTHIADFEIQPAPQNINGLLSLTELPEFIDYLSKINCSRKLKILFK